MLFEVFRFFRDNYYLNFEQFYAEFLKKISKNKNEEKKIKSFLLRNNKQILIRKKNYPFYSMNEIRFRFLRDKFFLKKKYETLMLEMCKEKKFNYKNYISKIYCNKKDIVNLIKEGHEIGLHTHNHPMNLDKLSYKVQKNELLKNFKILEKITKIKPISASFPTGTYNNNTLKILRDLSIKICFRDNMIPNKLKKINNSHLEIARINHAEIKI